MYLITIKRVFESLQELNDICCVCGVKLVLFNLGAYSTLVLVRGISVVTVVPSRAILQVIDLEVDRMGEHNSYGTFLLQYMKSLLIVTDGVRNPLVGGIVLSTTIPVDRVVVVHFLSWNS